MPAASGRDWVWIGAFSMIAATAVAFGSRTTHDADSVLTVFMSTQRLTWYYWEQNRFANFIPGLTAIFHDSAVNFHAQLILRNLSALFSFAFALVLLGEKTAFAAKFFATIVVWQLCAGKLILFTVAIAQPVSCALALCGLILLGLNGLTRPQALIVTLLGFLVFTAASMVNISLAVLLVPFAAGCWLLGRTIASPFARTTPVIVLLLSVVVAYAHAAMTPPGTPAAISFDWQSANNALAVIVNTVNLTILFSIVAASLTLGCLSLVLQRRGRLDALALELPVPHLLAIAAVLCCTLIFANLSWVRNNGNAERYYSVGTLILLTLASVWLVDFLTNAMGSLQQYLALFLGIIALALILLNAGQPTITRPFVSNVAGQERAINAEMAQMLAALPTTGPLLVVGDYWFAPPLLYQRSVRDSTRENLAITDHWAPMRDVIAELVQSRRNFTLACLRLTQADCLTKVSAWSGADLSKRTTKLLAAQDFASAGDFAALSVASPP